MVAICPDFKWLGFRICNPTSFGPFLVQISNPHCFSIAKFAPFKFWQILWDSNFGTQILPLIFCPLNLFWLSYVIGILSLVALICRKSHINFLLYSIFSHYAIFVSWNSMHSVPHMHVASNDHLLPALAVAQAFEQPISSQQFHLNKSRVICMSNQLQLIFIGNTKLSRSRIQDAGLYI